MQVSPADTNTTTHTILPADSVVVRNADSVMVAFINGSSVVKKMFSAKASVAVFSTTDFTGFPSGTSNLILQINAIKYQDTVINAKNYYFLKMGTYTKYYTPTR